jgi:hypothetical protein
VPLRQDAAIPDLVAVGPTVGGPGNGNLATPLHVAGCPQGMIGHAVTANVVAMLLAVAKIAPIHFADRGALAAIECAHLVIQQHETP